MSSKIKDLKGKRTVSEPMKLFTTAVIIVSVVFGIIAYNNSKTIFAKGLLKIHDSIEVARGPVLDLYKYYDNYDEADKDTDLVVTGVVTKIYPAEVVKTDEVSNYQGGEIVTFTTGYIPCDIKVDKVMKGSFKTGDIIQVQQNHVMSKNYKVGKKYLFFLFRGFETKDKIKIPCVDLNAEQGSIPITNGKVENCDKQQLIKAGVSEQKLITELERKILKLKASNKK